MFLVDVRELGEEVAVALVKAVRVVASTSGGDAKDGKAPLPRPRFDMFAEAEADLAVAMAVLDDESADESMRSRLKMMLDGDLDPTDHFVLDARYEGGLTVGAGRQSADPLLDFRRGALVAELFSEDGDLIGVA